MEVNAYLKKHERRGFPSHITGIKSVVAEVVGLDEELQTRVHKRLAEEATAPTRARRLHRRHK